MRKPSSITIASLLSLAMAAQSSLAASTPETAPAPSPSPSTVAINPSTMPNQMLRGNFSVTDGIYAVYKAKHELDTAHSNFVPGGKIGSIMDLSKSPVSFAVDSVSILLPFLLPSTWFQSKEASYELSAQESAYYLLELNEFATIYAMYETLINDMALEQVLQQQYADLADIAAILQQGQSISGGPSGESVQAQAAALAAKAQLESMQEGILQEKTALSQALGLDPTLDPSALILDATAHVPASTYEGQAVAVLLPQALKIAPEAAQMTDLINASKQQKWSDVFAFLNAFSLDNSGSGGGSSTSGSSSSSSSSSFGDIGFSGSVSLGFSTFPTVALDNDNTKELQHELSNLSLTEGQILQSSLGSIVLEQGQLVDNSAAEASATEYYDIERNNYTDGLTDLQHVLDAENAKIQDSTARIKSQADLDSLRINLHRVFLTDKFTTQFLPPCITQGNIKKSTDGPFEWIKDIFSGKAADKTIDELCRAGL